MGVARAQTQGCLCVSNPRDPRRGRQRSDHQPPDGGGEGLRGQLLGQHQEGQAVGGPSQPHPVPTGALGHRHSWEPCEVGGRDGKTGGGGQAWRGQERARGGDRGPGSDPTGYRRPPPTPGPPRHHSAHPPRVPICKARAPRVLSLQSPCAPAPSPHLGKFGRKRSEPASEPRVRAGRGRAPGPAGEGVAPA